MKALVVVDYQYDFVEGTLGFPGASELEGPISEKIMKAKAEGADIYFTMDCHGPDYLDTQEGRRLPIEHCNTPDGMRLYGKMDALSVDGTVIRKPSFGSIELFETMRERKYDEVELCGVVTNICVISNAILVKTALPEAKVVVDAGCVGGGDKALNDKALDVMAGLQIDIINR